MQILCPPLLQRLLANSAWALLGSGAGRLLNLAAMILIARHLGLTGFGWFGLIQATLGLFGVFAGAGLGAIATRYIAEYRHKYPDRAGRILTFLHLLAFCLATALLLLLCLCAETIALGLSAGSGSDLSPAVSAGAFLLFANTLRAVQEGALAGLEAFRDTAILKLTDGLLILILAPGFAAKGGVSGAMQAMAFAGLLTLGLGFACLSRQLRAARITPALSGLRGEAWPLLSGSLPVLTAQALGAPVLWLGLWWLSRQPGGIGSAALYNAAYQWQGPLIFAPMVLSTVALPLFVQLHSQGDHPGFRRLFTLTGLAATGFALLLTMALILWRGAIMAGYGPGFRGGETVLLLFALAAPCNVLASLGTTALHGLNRPWLVLATSLLWALIFITAAGALIPETGATGLALAFLLAYASLALVRIALTLALTRRSCQLAEV